MNNTKDTKPKKPASQERTSKPSGNALPTIRMAELPPEILAAIQEATKTANLVAIAPNTTTALITPRDTCEMATGYTVVLVFKDQKIFPENHELGKVYVLD